jgi:hypothetical protein
MLTKEATELLDFLQLSRPQDKATLILEVQKKFNLVRDRSVYCADSYAIRFSSSSSNGFSNTVLSLSSLRKYDDLPFFVCLVTPIGNLIYLANTTFLAKISHSSQELTADNIKGSFNGSDIMKVFAGIENSPKNFNDLLAIHDELGFEGNLIRLVEATTGISPSGHKYLPNEKEIQTILRAPERAANFMASTEYSTLKTELDDRVNKYEKEILIAGLIENVNIRGRIIEYLVAGEDEKIRRRLVDELHNHVRISRFRTKNTLADYFRNFDNFVTATDVKTKIMTLKSNPKAYNLDKMLEFLSVEKSVLLFYFIGLGPHGIVGQMLTTVFQKNLLGRTLLLKHWAGRNSRGVAQFEGEVIHKLILSPSEEIDQKMSRHFLEKLIGF